MKKPTPKATKTVYPIICQTVNAIPAQFIAEAAKAHGVLSRAFSPKSHVAAMPCCQVSKTESLNSICDVARANETLWTSMGVSVPRRNTLSNANAVRPSAMAKDLYWKTYGHLSGIAPKFGKGPHRGYCFRIKAPMFAVDSSTVRLTTDSFNWARHRREKAAAKLHLTFDLGNRLPSFAIVEDAAHHDSVRAAELTAHLRAGDIAVADRAYADFGFMDGLDACGVRFVTRQKRNMRMRVAEIYRDRWGIETFFKELKQTCQIHDFIGYSENAVQWQVWTGLLAHLLFRHLAYLSKWGLSFSRLAALVRGVLWNRRRLVETLRLYGTAGPVKSPSVKPKRLVFQLVFDFTPAEMGQQTC